MLGQCRRRWPALIYRDHQVSSKHKSCQLYSGSILATVSDANPVLSIHRFNIVCLLKKKRNRDRVHLFTPSVLHTIQRRYKYASHTHVT